MNALMRLLLRPLLPEIRRLEDLPPLADPVPGPEYHQAMAKAQAARERAERIVANHSQSKPRSTRPA